MSARTCSRASRSACSAFFCPALVFLEPALFDGLPAPRGSLSAYYYSGLRELFVGGLWAIGVFLVVYEFLDFSWRASGLARRCGCGGLRGLPDRAAGDGVTLTPSRSSSGVGRHRHRLRSCGCVHRAADPDRPLLRPGRGKRAHRSWQGFHTVSAALDSLRRRPRRFRGHHGRAGQGSPLRRVDRDLGLRRLLAREGRRAKGAVRAPRRAAAGAGGSLS